MANKLVSVSELGHALVETYLGDGEFKGVVDGLADDEAAGNHHGVKRGRPARGRPSPRKVYVPARERTPVSRTVRTHAVPCLVPAKTRWGETLTFRFLVGRSTRDIVVAAAADRGCETSVITRCCLEAFRRYYERFVDVVVAFRESLDEAAADERKQRSLRRSRGATDKGDYGKVPD